MSHSWRFMFKTISIYVSLMKIYDQNKKDLCLIHGDLCSKTKTTII